VLFRSLFIGSFPSEARPEHVTPEALELVRQHANNDNIVIGAQSGSQRTLDACRRGHTVEDVARATRLILRFGFKANVDFIIGLPDETDEDMEQTGALVQELAALGARIHVHFFLPLPQTLFGTRKPSTPNKRLLRVLNRLMGRGQVYGEWQQQQKLTRRLIRSEWKQL
jgi:radical SAM superfamily enzyme YgiQ (UPF0313 family)